MPATPHARLVWLFDVDGTLLTTEGAAREAFAAALAEGFGVEDDLRGIAFAGRTDPLILGDIFARHGLSPAPEEEARFWDRAFDGVRAGLAAERGRLLPGVTRVLDAIAAAPGWVPALLTGNATQMAQVKLGHFGLYDRFAFGAFGEMAGDRNALARVAVGIARERHGVPPERCVVVGDTELDIACARAAGAHAVAVATGARSRDELAVHVPDLLLDDLADPAPLLAWARELTAHDPAPAP